MSPLTGLIVEILSALKAIDRFHNEIFPLGQPLCIKGVPIDHTSLNEAYAAAQQALQMIERMK